MHSALGQIDLPLSLGSIELGGMGFLLFCVAGVVAITALARRELRNDLRQRRSLLDAAAGLFENPSVTVGGDGYPRLHGTCSGGHKVSLEVVPDSLVPRRLPQLWLQLTLLKPEAAPRPSIGVLARPIGTEFYSRVLGLPDTIAPSFTVDFPLLMRGRGATEAAIQRTSGLFRTLFADPELKEIVITPRGAGTVRRIAEGDRGAHVLYRQMRFPVTQVSPEFVRNALAELHLLNEALEPSPVS